MSRTARWEVGSSFPLWSGNGSGWVDAPQPLRLYGSGRQALAALLRFGERTYGWTRVHLPAYYCPPVARAVSEILPVSRYDTGPESPAVRPDPGPTEVVLSVSYFGGSPVTPVQPGAGLIVDATHDPLAPWLTELRPDYVVAGLRKTLPLPDGGAVWSPQGHSLPPKAALTRTHLATVARILSAMAMKASYLAGVGDDAEKERYLAAYASGEEGLGDPGISGASDYTRHLLRLLPVHDLRRRRQRNARTLADALGELPGVEVRRYPYGVVLVVESARRRAEVKSGLITERIYPAVLWPMDGQDAPERLHAYSERMLLLHSDFRWRSRDMKRVAAVVRAQLIGTRDTVVDDIRAVDPGLPGMRRPAPTRAATAGPEGVAC
ncbi:hypothetical protein GA0070624_2844 [Micromonospora rhizosphaerae]|uniref:dTDP-4-amino-4,6-dideoxygalactose transaminase n=1 Tax=Micromonospora rhizosphaerae TaxID=568872 RepID=A0A1C6S3G7_9ACTN|nr:hypothetical protein GA0070624_2844 [Micromonospora rhizosphaerae]